MAFQNLRQGSTVYIFYKGPNPKLEIGTITDEPKLRQKPNTQAQPSYNPNIAAMPPEQVLDISIKIGDKILPAEGLTPSYDIQDCGSGIFIACTREAINSTVVAYKQISDAILEPSNLEMHQNISKNCELIIATINPEIAERKKREAEMMEMKRENKELKTEMLEMKGMIRNLLEQLGAGTPAKQK